MDADIAAFIDRYCRELDAARGVSRRGGATEAEIEKVAAEYGARFGLELPMPYVEICKIENGMGGGGYGTLYALAARPQPGEEWPEMSLLENFDAQVVDLGIEQFISFGTTDGFEQYGWHLQLNAFVKIVSNPDHPDKRYDSFEAMFRDLFRSHPAM